MNQATEKQVISFIGGGNMAHSIIGGLVASGWAAGRIYVSDPVESRRNLLEQEFGVHVHHDNQPCVENSRIVVFAVKPQLMRQAVTSIDHQLRTDRPLVMSIAAGIRIADIIRWIGAPLPVVRVMPNTPALINSGVSAMLANPQTSDHQRMIAESVMQSVGSVVWVDSERDIDVVTGISGAGPAYYFKLMEIMINSARDNGLDQQTATTLVLQTAVGAARLALASEHPPAQLRQQVTSPGGVTEAALSSMEENGIDRIIADGIEAAIEKSNELAIALGET